MDLVSMIHQHVDYKNIIITHEISNMKSLSHYKLIATLFKYPGQSFSSDMHRFLEYMEAKSETEKTAIKHFVKQAEILNLKEQQEYYLKTFDVGAICYLDIGYMMFGEDYKRAQLLVNLQNEHTLAGTDCGSELADHLPNVLSLLSTTDNKDFAEELGFIITLPAVKFMLSKFKSGENYYEHLFEVLLGMLERDFNGEHLQEFAMEEARFNGKNEFLIPSPKMAVCNSNCKQKRF